MTRLRRLVGVAVAVMGICLMASPPTFAAGTWPDGEYHYRVLLSDVTITVVCQGGTCEVRPFTIEKTGAMSVEVKVADPIRLVDGAATVSLPPVEAALCGQTRTLSMTVSPDSDLKGTVVANAVSTPTCVATASTTGFAAELTAAPILVHSSVPSVLSKLRSMSDVTPGEVGAASGGAVVLVALVAFPATLLNTAVESASSRLAGWRRRRRGTGEEGTGAAGSRWWWAAGGVLGASLISMFVDPRVGLNAGTARLLASLFSSFILEVFVGWFAVLLLMRRWVPSAIPTYTFQPASLLLVAGLVLFSRMTEFEPGIVFGLVAGISFLAVESRRERAFEKLVPTAWAFGVAALAWALYSALGPQHNGAALFASETLAAAVVGGVAALPLVLLPLKGLPGGPIFLWRRRVWAICYAVVLAAFFVVLMPFPGSWSEIDGSLIGWLLGYACYLGIGLLAWLLLRDTDEESTPE